MPTEWKTLKEVVDELDISLPRLRSWTKKGLVESTLKNYRCYIPTTEYPKIKRIIELFAEASESNQRLTFPEVKEQLAKENLYQAPLEPRERDHTKSVADEDNAEQVSHILQALSESQEQLRKEYETLRQQMEEVHQKLDTLVSRKESSSSPSESTSESSSEFPSSPSGPPSEEDYQTKVEEMLQKEARELWNQKPRQERMRGIGFLKFKEDREEKARFITIYTNQNYQKRYQQLVQSHAK